MSLLIEIAGESPVAQRLAGRVMALKGFEVSVVTGHDTGTAVDVAGRGHGVAILHEDVTTGAIEGLPVVTVSLRKEM